MLTVEDVAVDALVPWDALEPTWPAEPLPLAAAPMMRSRGRRVLRSAVWLLAVVYLVVEQAGAALGRGLEGYVRATDAAGRAVRRACLAVLRWLGPLGRLVRRLAAPVVRLLVRCWDRMSVWLLLRMFRPLRRWAQALVDRCRPPLERLMARLSRLVAHLAPLVQALTAAVDAVEAAAARLGSGWRRLWSPVLRVVQSLRRPPRGSRRGRRGCGRRGA